VPDKNKETIDQLIAGDFLYTRDPEFRAFVEQLPADLWAKKDLSAVRLGWEAYKKLHDNKEEGKL